MSSSQNGKFRQKAGRRDIPLPDDGKPRTILAAKLRELKKACGGPTYDELAALSNVYKTGLVEAASVTGSPKLYVVEGYVKGCWAYHEKKFHVPFAGAGDLSQWRKLHADACGPAPGKSLPEKAGERDEQPGLVLTLPSDDVVPPKGVAGNAPENLPESTLHFSRRARTLAASATAAIIVLIVVVVIYPRPGPVMSVQRYPGGSMSVTAPAPACGRAAADGLRSPARTPFTDVKLVRTVSLDGFSARAEQGTYRGGSYVWVQVSPTGRKAGFQLRWSNAPGEKYYCTATVAAGDVSALPGKFATVAVPATVGGRHVTYQACIWHQDPFASQCSSQF
jgi:hypothetical protein